MARPGLRQATTLFRSHYAALRVPCPRLPAAPPRPTLRLVGRLTGWGCPCRTAVAALPPAVPCRGYSTSPGSDGPPKLSRAERRRQARAKKKGRPIPQAPVPAAAVGKEDGGATGGGLELGGVTDLGIFRSIKQNFRRVPSASTLCLLPSPPAA